MTWIVAAILSAALLGVVSIVDGYLISKRMPEIRSFLIPAGITHFVLGTIFLVIHPLSWEAGTVPILMAFISGILRSIGILLMLRALRSEEVSLVVPVTHTFPIFVALLAVPLLNETLDYMGWLAIFITVAGAVLVSIRRDARKPGAHLSKSFAVLMLSSFLMGAANTGSKYALDYMSFWDIYSVNAICLGALFLAYSVRSTTLSELWNMKRRNRVLFLIAGSEGIALVGIVLSFWAMEQGPVSLVSTLLSIRPAFVFLYAMALSHVLPDILEERFTRNTLFTKALSVALIITGIAIINL